MIEDQQLTNVSTEKYMGVSWSEDGRLERESENKICAV